MVVRSHVSTAVGFGPVCVLLRKLCISTVNTIVKYESIGVAKWGVREPSPIIFKLSSHFVF